jgi:thioesterase domain-containing protein
MWEEVLGVRPVGVRDDFFALGGHSLDAVRVVQQIERLFGQRLPLSVLHANPTVENLARGSWLAIAISSRSRCSAFRPVAASGRSSSSTAASTGVASTAASWLITWVPNSRSWRSTTRSRPPAGAGDDRGDGGGAPGRRPGAAATRSVLSRRVLQGGLTAYEVARRLALSGERVELNVLIAAAADMRFALLRRLLDRLGLSESERVELFGRVRYLADRLAAASLRGKLRIGTASGLRFAAKNLARLGGGRRSRLTRPVIPADAGAAVRVADGLVGVETYERHFTAVMAYLPETFHGRVLAFWPTEEPLRRSSDPTLGWGSLVEHLDLVRVPGDHHTIVTRHCELIAREILARQPLDAGRTARRSAAW